MGASEITDYYLEAMIKNGEFLVNARLLDSTGKHAVTINDSIPEKGTFEKKMTSVGYDVVAADGELLLGIQIDANQVCHLRGKLYDSDGRVVAEESGTNFLVHRGPAVLGKSGNARGIVIEA